MIYLDNHATTRVDPNVLDAMLPYFTEQYGNSGSLSALVWRSRLSMRSRGRRVILLPKAIGAEASEIIFTSGATESNNLAIRGVADRATTAWRSSHQRANRTSRSAKPNAKASAGLNYDVTLVACPYASRSEAGWPPQCAAGGRLDPR